MTLYQLILLNEIQRAEALWEYGVHIAEREEKQYKHLLYQIDTFYVEVHYDAENNVLEGMTPFASLKRLELYLDQITLQAF